MIPQTAGSWTELRKVVVALSQVTRTLIESQEEQGNQPVPMWKRPNWVGGLPFSWERPGGKVHWGDTKWKGHGPFH